MSNPRSSPLRVLVDILSSAVQVIDERYAAEHLEFPFLDDPCVRGSDAERLMVSDARVTEAISCIVAAAAQLTAAVEFPTLALTNAAFSYNLSASLSVASYTNLAEILREAGPSGLHVDDIAKKNGTHPGKIGHILRLLATHHIFREISPNVFTNNRLSSMLDTSKSTEELITKPQERHTGTSTISSYVEIINDGYFKAAAYWEDIFRDPKSDFLHSEEPTKTPFNLAYNTELSYWEWLEKPENSRHMERFAVAMEGSRKLEVPDAILKGFNWGSLPAGAVVVDVGSGLGTSSLPIAEKYPHLKIVLQDSPSVIRRAREYWMTALPNAVSSNTVTFNDHNFLAPQPVKKASIFLLRAIIHGLNDTRAQAILHQLRDVATPQTKLLMVEISYRYACPDTAKTDAIPGAASLPSPPAPLLANYGRASAPAYLLDILMASCWNSKERTLAELVCLAAAAGWKVVQVFQIPGSSFSHIVAEPSS